MKLIIWSARNRKASLIIMITIQFVIGSYLIWFGNWLTTNSIIMPELVKSIIISIFLVIMVIYPTKKFNFKLNNIRRRKSLDFFVALMSFIVMVYVGNSIGNGTFIQQSNISKVFSADVNIDEKSTSFEIQEKETELKNRTFSKKILNKKTLQNKTNYRYLKKEVKHLKTNLKSNKLSLKGKILIVLTILGALIATFFLAGLACQISCNGAGILAIIVFVAGFSAILAFSIYIIKSIIKKHKKTIIIEQKSI